MKLHKTAVIGIILLILIGGIVWYRRASQSSKVKTPDIKIGAVLGLTGSASADSLNIKRGLELARADLLKQGVNVEINYQDDNTDPKQTVAAIQYLAATYHPQAIIGPVWGFLEEAGDPVLAANKIISYAPPNTSEFVSAKDPYAFRGAPRNALLEQPLAEWLKANKKTHAAIIVSKDAWGNSVAAPMRAAVKDVGGNVVVDETIQSFSSDVAGQVATILVKTKQANADVILWTGYDSDATALVQRKLQLGLDIPLIAASNGYAALLSRKVVSVNQLKNAYFMSVPISPDFVDKFKTVYGQVPGNYTDRAYDGLMLLVDAFKNAPQKDSDSIATYIRHNTAYKGYAGEYKFNNDGDIIGGQWVIKPIVAQ